MDPFDFVDSIHRLDFLRLGTEVQLPAGVRHVTIDTIPTYEMNKLRVQMRAYVLADHLPPATVTESTTIKIPTTTWQMWKSRNGNHWWGRMIARRWPTKMEHRKVSLTLSFERYRTYPEATVELPENFGTPVLVSIRNRERWDII